MEKVWKYKTPQINTKETAYYGESDEWECRTVVIRKDPFIARNET